MRRGRETTGGPARAWGGKGALVGKTGKTAVLPGFCVIECSGGGSGVACLKFSAAPLGGMPL